MYDNYVFDLYGTLVDIRTNESKASLWKSMAAYMTLQGAPYSAAELRKRYRALISDLRQQQYEKRGLSCMYIHTAQSPELAGRLPHGCRRLKDITDVLLQS